MPESKLENPGYLLQKPQVALFRVGDRYYVVSNRIKATCNITDYFHLAWLSKHKHELVQLIGDMDSGNNAYLMYCADCAFPPMYIAFADSEADAIDVFIDETDICKVQDSASTDYKKDDVIFNSNGEAHDTEQLMYESATLIALYY